MKLKDYVKIAKFGDIVELASPGYQRFVLFVGNFDTNPYITTIWVEETEKGYCAKTAHSSIALNEVLEVKIIKKVDNQIINLKMNKLTTTLKRMLSKNIQQQYKAGLRNGDIELTDRGKQELLEILAQEKEKELTDIAKEIIVDNEDN